MRILFTTESMRLGGAENIAVDTANALADRGEDQIFFAAAQGDMYRKLSKDVRYYNFPEFHLFNIYTILRSLRTIIKDVKPDVLHSHGATLGVLAGISCLGIKSYPKKILTRHDRYFSRACSSMAKWLLIIFYDHIIAVSKSQCDVLKSTGVPLKSLSVIPNFVDCSHINNIVNSTD